MIAISLPWKMVSAHVLQIIFWFMSIACCCKNLTNYTTTKTLLVMNLHSDTCQLTEVS